MRTAFCISGNDIMLADSTACPVEDKCYPSMVVVTPSMCMIAMRAKVRQLSK